jgi:hypothetical protein
MGAMDIAMILIPCCGKASMAQAELNTSQQDGGGGTGTVFTNTVAGADINN